MASDFGRTNAVNGAGPPVLPVAASSSPRRGGRLLDPGWLFVIAGLMVLGATVLVPASDDLNEARFLRDRAKLIYQHRADRLKRYREYVDAVDAQDPSLVVALASSQLNEVPTDRRPIDGWEAAASAPGEAVYPDASVFPALEPPALVLPPRREIGSLLERLATQDRSRLWMLAGGAVLVLLGLLPRAIGRGLAR